MNSALPVLTDSEWAQEDWFPRVFDAGWSYWAIVMPDKVVGKMNMRGLIEEISERGLPSISSMILRRR